MKLYSCKLRLAGATTNEIFKGEVTAAEIEVLRELHGIDAVLDIKEAGENSKTSAEERVRLKQLYANPESLNTQMAARRLTLLRNLFGHDRLPLPDEVMDPVVASDDDFEEPTAVEAPVRRTRVKKAEPEAAFE
ncbi:hypothetical protein [Bradyrhizobium stylosanthis]|uniref:Uncharacterized protein n=1 Tax=Bradyrhizobium stylosanthis TaxID=1803665 RepID=A0A560CXK3_9BRAD|nr:hypothetical protein [Bradyrhizobium stylosanthis]TWA89580.1 hypothetical protein FBZ96_11948 [Bradyrhizobium stylosanthis]